MKRKRKLFGVSLLLIAILVLQLPPAGADAASVPEFSISGAGVLLSYNGTSTDVVIPSTVIEIATDAFRDNDKIRKVTIPNSVRKINKYAFWDCDNLQSIQLGYGINKIEDFCFANCMGLVSITIPSSVKSIGIYAFEDDVNLEAVTITENTHVIHDSAFDGCYKLVIFAPEGSYPWEYAQGFYIRQAKFPVYEETGTIDDPDNHDETSDASDTDVSGNDDGSDQADNGDGAYTTQFDVVQRPDGTYTAVAYNQNTDIYGESHVVGNAAVLFIDNSAFHVIDGTAQTAQNPASDGSGDPSGSNTDIPQNTVMYSSSIPKYTIVDSRIVADKAFYLSGDLENMSLPKGIREIGQFAFSRTEVVSVTLPDTVEKIDYGAFYHCDMLKEVSLPQSVMKIEPYAFNETALVKDFMSVRGGSINNNLDNDLNASEGDFLVRGGALLAYRGNKTNVTIPDGVRIIAAGVFMGNERMETLAFPDTLISIGEDAFNGCSNLREVSFGGNEVEILDRAFKGTLVSIADKPERILNVGIGAFDDLDKAIGLNITHEESAERLSNVSYRASDEDPENAGVTVVGNDSFKAYLDGADRAYTLTVGDPEVAGKFEESLRRASEFISEMGIADRFIFDITLTDSSGIPITKLGNQGLEIGIPVPENMSGRELIVLTSDRNGQLEDIPVTIVDSPEGKFARFTTFHLSTFALCSTDKNLDDSQIITSEVVLRADSGSPVPCGLIEENAFKRWLSSRGTIRLIICGLLIITGLFFISVRKKTA